MKKILWFLFGLALLAGFGAVAKNTWDTAAFFQAKGRAGTIKIESKYNASRWGEPLPIKKIHSYGAVLAPDHALILESDQTLPPNQEHFVLFLLRDTAATARELSLRPLVGTLRLKSVEDGAPVRLADTDIFDRLVDKAMGPPAEGVYVRPREVAEAGPNRAAPTVPFVLAGQGDSTLEIIWNNSTIGEWLIAGFWLLAIKMVLLHAWVTPFDATRKTGDERPDFIHPSMRKIEPDATEAASKRISYVPKPADHDYIQANPAKSPHPSAGSPPPPATPDQDSPAAKKSISLPATAQSPTAPPPPAEPYSTATTSPFVPSKDADDTVLKLSRKPRPPQAPGGSGPAA